MDLLKLEKQLINDLKTHRPDAFRHSASIEVKVSRGSYIINIFGWWSLEEEWSIDSPTGHIYTHHKTSIKAAVAAFQAELLGLDNKVELTD